MNSVNLAGRLGAAPEVKYTQSGKQVTDLRVATGYGDRTQWHTVTVWGDLPDFVLGLDKGASVAVSGELRYREYDDQSGNRRKVAEVVVNSGYGVTVLGGRESQRDGGGQRRQPQQQGGWNRGGQAQRGGPQEADPIPF